MYAMYAVTFMILLRMTMLHSKICLKIGYAHSAA